MQNFPPGNPDDTEAEHVLTRTPRMLMSTCGGSDVVSCIMVCQCSCTAALRRHHVSASQSH